MLLTSGNKDKLSYKVFSNREEMGSYAGKLAEEKLIRLLKEKEEVRMVFAAAPSQSDMLSYLTASKEIDWSRVTGFHMDEYLDLPADSDQWFRIYLQDHLVNKVDFKDFHFINGETSNPVEEAERYAALLQEKPIDMVCLGIGENGHIAFNDPPVANFEDPKAVKMVELDHACRTQQVNDGCFPNLEKVPTHAITLTIPALVSAQSLVCTVPGETKQTAVKEVLIGEISTSCPATILRKHKDVELLLDREAYGGNDFDQ